MLKVDQFLRVAALFGALSGVCSPGMTQTVSLTYEYYEFDARTVAEVDKVMFEVTPISLFGTPYAGHTGSSYAWMGRWVDGGAGCSMTMPAAVIEKSGTVSDSARRA